MNYRNTISPFIRLITLSLLCLLLFSACQNRLSDPVEMPSIDPAVNNPPETNIPSTPVPGFGTHPTVEFNIISPDITNSPENTAEQINIPLYQNPYPMGHPGLEIPVTDDLLDSIKENAVEFLQFAEIDIPDDIFNARIEIVESTEQNRQPATYYWDYDGYFIVANATGIGVSIDNVLSSPDADITSEILSLPLVQTATAYLNITEPAISAFPDSDNDSLVWVLYEHNDNERQALYNSAFHCVHVKYFPFLNSLTVYMMHVPAETITGYYSLLPYEAVKESVLEQTNRAEDSLISSRLYYDIKIRHGFYVPAYEFVFDTAAPNATMQNNAGKTMRQTCETIVVPAVKLDAD